MNWNKQKPPRRAAPQKLQSSHMHESKYILIHDFEFSKNPRACMNQKTKSCAPSPAALQSSHIHESKQRRCKASLQSSHMHELKTKLQRRAHANYRLQPSRMHELKYISDTELQNKKNCCNPRACMNWNTLIPIPNVSNIRLQSSRMHESK